MTTGADEPFICEDGARATDHRQVGRGTTSAGQQLGTTARVEGEQRSTTDRETESREAEGASLAAQLHKFELDESRSRSRMLEGGRERRGKGEEGRRRRRGGGERKKRRKNWRAQSQANAPAVRAVEKTKGWRRAERKAGRDNKSVPVTHEIIIKSTRPRRLGKLRVARRRLTRRTLIGPSHASRERHGVKGGKRGSGEG